MRKSNATDQTPMGVSTNPSIYDVFLRDETFTEPTLPEGKKLDEVIFEDTKQKNGHHAIKHESFERSSIPLVSARLEFGDYARHGVNRVVDTKRAVAELEQDLMWEASRSEISLKKALAKGYSYIILVENNLGITCTEDLLTKGWKNPHCYGGENIKPCPWLRGMMCDPTNHNERCHNFFKRSTKPADAQTFVQTIHHLESQYSVYFLYCTPEESADRICELLHMN